MALAELANSRLRPVSSKRTVIQPESIGAQATSPNCYEA